MTGFLPLITLLACTDAAPTAERLIPDYQGVETRLLDNDLVQFNVAMTNALTAADVEDYAECAAAGYTIIRGWGFARHLRTNVVEEAGVWRGDAIYTISRALPEGQKTIDAEVVASSCAEKGIPTV